MPYEGALLSLLTESEAGRIHEGALHVLDRTGIVVHDEQVLSLLDQAGCPVSRDHRRVHIPAPVVEGAVAQAPRQVCLYDRRGERAMALGAGALHGRTSSGATGILDLESGLRRQPTSQDAAGIARLADALPHVQGVSTMAAQPADVPVLAVDVHAVRIALANTVKPLGYVCLNEPLIELVLDMLAVVVGGEDELRERPISLALDLIHQVGPGGAFVATDHTLRHFRTELLVPDLIERGSREEWQAAAAPDMCESAREKARRILADHRPLPLADGVAAQLDEIVREAEARTVGR